MDIFLIGILVLATLVYAGFTFFFITGLIRRPESRKQTETPPVAVIIAARNEELDLPNLLEDLAGQDYAGPYEVIIANDRSSDATGLILERFSKKHPNFRAVHITTKSSEMTPKKHALTECLKHTTAEIILATDADCRVGSSWISSGIEQMDPETGILVGYAEVQASRVFERYQALDYIGIVVSNAGMMSHGYAWSGSGANLAYRRSAFTSIGGFNPVAGKVSGDDFYLVQSIPAKTQLKAKFNFDPRHFVKTQPTSTLPAFLTQRIRWSSNSKGLEKSDPLFFGFLVSAFLTNFMVLISLILTWSHPMLWMCLAVKLLVEGLVMLVGARPFGYWSHIWVFPLWFVLQPLYISYVGLMGLRGKYQWKA